MTVVATLLMADRALAAAELLAVEGMDVEVIDLRWLRPLDADTVLASIANPGPARRRRGASPPRRLGRDVDLSTGDGVCSAVRAAACSQSAGGRAGRLLPAIGRRSYPERQHHRRSRAVARWKRLNDRNRRLGWRPENGLCSQPRGAHGPDS